MKSADKHSTRSGPSPPPIMRVRAADIRKICGDRVTAVVADESLRNYSLAPEERQIIAQACEASPEISRN